MRDSEPADLIHRSTSAPSPHTSKLVENILELRLQQKLDTSKTLELTHEAIGNRNLRAIELLAETFPHVVAEALQSEFLDSNFIIESTGLIFQIKDFLAPKLEKLYLDKIIPRLINQSENIFHSFNRSKYPIQDLSPIKKNDP